MVSAIFGSPASAVNNDSISVYYDQPFVQGSYAAGTLGTTVENFNLATVGPCPTSLAVGTLSGTCNVGNPSVYGGAETTTSTQTVGGFGSRFATTVGAVDPIEITLSGPSKYFGFWWSAGSPGNTVKFYSGNQLVITLTTQTIMGQFGTLPNPWPGSNLFTAIDNSQYNKGWYFGNPRGYSSISPTRASPITAGEPFVYLHLFAGGSLTFDKVVLTGAGFEFDNLTVSTEPQTVNPRLVLAETLIGNRAVTFRNNTGSGNMSDQVTNTSTALTANSFTKTGYSFTGWNTQSDGLGTAYTNREIYSFDQALELFAQWQLTPYNVSYNTQGGSSESPDTYTMGSSVTLPTTPSRSGFTFTGWFTSSSSGSPLGSSYSPPGTGDITLWAQWDQLYTLSYDTQGGSGVPSQTFTPGETLNLAAAPTRPGYAFTGWFTSSAGGSALSGPSYSPPGSVDQTLYAHWLLIDTQLAQTGSSAPNLLWVFSLFLLAGLSTMFASLANRSNANKR